MKYILEFAKVRDISIGKGIEIPSDVFKNDTRPVVDIIIKSCNKVIFLKWYDTHWHNIANRIHYRTTFNSVSEFNEFIKKAFNDLIDNHFKEIDKSDRYALYFEGNNFYFIIDINIDNLFKEWTTIFVVTISNTTPDEKIYKIIEINDEYF